MPTKHPYTTNEDWLALRQEDITSTESSALFGLSPYTTEFELWYVKHGKAEDSFQEDERMRWGKRLEPMIAKGMAEDLFVTVQHITEYMRHSEEPHMGSSFDYEITGITSLPETGSMAHEVHKLFLEHGPGLMEIKGIDYLRHRDTWSENEATDYIETQVQHQMEVADVEWCLIVALVGGNDPKVIIRMRDREVGKGLRKAVQRFWERTEAPEPDFTRDFEFITNLHQSAGGAVMETDDAEVWSLLDSYEHFKEEAKKYDDKKKAIKAEILMTVGDEYSKVVAKTDGGSTLTLHCGMTKASEGKPITPDMVGNLIGGRKSYRGFRVTEKGVKE